MLNQCANVVIIHRKHKGFKQICPMCSIRYAQKNFWHFAQFALIMIIFAHHPSLPCRQEKGVIIIYWIFNRSDRNRSRGE